MNTSMDHIMDLDNPEISDTITSSTLNMITVFTIRLSDQRRWRDHVALNCAQKVVAHQNMIARIRLSPQSVQHVFRPQRRARHLKTIRALMEIVQNGLLYIQEFATELSPDVVIDTRYRLQINSLLVEIRQAKFESLKVCMVVIKGELDMLDEFIVALTATSSFPSVNEADRDDLFRLYWDLESGLEDWENQFGVGGDVRLQDKASER